MADNTPVNSQITDAVTQTNVKVLGEAPAQAMAVLYQTLAHSVSLAMQNSMQAQGGLQQISNAITSTACKQILEISSGGNTKSDK